MRPRSIVNFERVVLLGILVGIVNSVLSWDKMLAMTQAQAAAQGGAMKIGPGFLIGVQAFFIVIYLLLVWLIARKGSPVAKWIYVVLAVLSLIAAIFGLGKMAAYGTVSLVLAIVQHLLTLAALWFLFQPDAKAWFAEGRTADPADL
jgi:Na+-transporting NADH:ubiquinone oxidoreductase subunit NqrD